MTEWGSTISTRRGPAPPIRDEARLAMAVVARALADVRDVRPEVAESARDFLLDTDGR